MAGPHHEDETPPSEQSLYNLLGDLRFAQEIERLTGTVKPIEAMQKLCDAGYVRDVMRILDRLINPRGVANQFLACIVSKPDVYPGDCAVLEGGKGSRASYYILIYEKYGEKSGYSDLTCIALDKSPVSDTSSSPAYYARPCTLTELSSLVGGQDRGAVQY